VKDLPDERVDRLFISAHFTQLSRMVSNLPLSLQILQYREIRLYIRPVVLQD